MEVLQVSNVDYSTYQEVFDCDYSEIDDFDVAVGTLAKRLEIELRAAKHTHLSCGEVLLPHGLLGNVAREILESADSELYGLRGCTLHMCFEGEQECRKLTTIKCDPSTVSTFELKLTLKQTPAGWNSFLPQFLKKITGGGAVMISPTYTLTKTRLYRTYK